MPKIPLTNRQFQHIAIVNQQIAELDAKRKTLLEMVLDSSEAVGKNIKILRIDETGIEYVEQPHLTSE